MIEIIEMLLHYLPIFPLQIVFLFSEFGREYHSINPCEEINHLHSTQPNIPIQKKHTAIDQSVVRAQWQHFTSDLDTDSQTLHGLAGESNQHPLGL